MRGCCSWKVVFENSKAAFGEALLNSRSTWFRRKVVKKQRNETAHESSCNNPWLKFRSLILLIFCKQLSVASSANPSTFSRQLSREVFSLCWNTVPVNYYEISIAYSRLHSWIRFALTMTSSPQPFYLKDPAERSPSVNFKIPDDEYSKGLSQTFALDHDLGASRCLSELRCSCCQLLSSLFQIPPQSCWIFSQMLTLSGQICPKITRDWPTGVLAHGECKKSSLTAIIWFLPLLRRRCKNHKSTAAEDKPLKKIDFIQRM